MQIHLFLRAFLAIMIIGAAPLSATAEDDPGCVRLSCLGKCISKEEAEGKAIPMLCMRQYSCYNGVDCAKLEDGKCGWKETPQLKACLAEKSGPILAPNAQQQ